MDAPCSHKNTHACWQLPPWSRQAIVNTNNTAPAARFDIGQFRWLTNGGRSSGAAVVASFEIVVYYCVHEYIAQVVGVEVEHGR